MPLASSKSYVVRWRTHICGHVDRLLRATTGLYKAVYKKPLKPVLERGMELLALVTYAKQRKMNDARAVGRGQTGTVNTKRRYGRGSFMGSTFCGGAGSLARFTPSQYLAVLRFLCCMVYCLPYKATVRRVASRQQANRSTSVCSLLGCRIAPTNGSNPVVK